MSVLTFICCMIVYLDCWFSLLTSANAWDEPEFTAITLAGYSSLATWSMSWEDMSIRDLLMISGGLDVDNRASTRSCRPSRAVSVRNDAIGLSFAPLVICCSCAETSYSIFLQSNGCWTVRSELMVVTCTGPLWGSSAGSMPLSW